MSCLKTIYFGPFELDVDKIPKTNLWHSKEKDREELKASIKEHGCLNPLEMLLEKGTLRFVKGNQRITVMKELGYCKFDCFIRAHMTEENKNFLEILMQILPVYKKENGHCCKTAIPYKES